MQQPEQLILEPLLSKSIIRRRSLLPVWIKVFVWIFMVIGATVPFALILGIFGFSFQAALYGLQTYSPLEPLGLSVISLFLLKGIVAYGLWFEKAWAVNMGIVDAILGIIICAYVMLVHPFMNTESSFTINIRLELAALIPYLIKLQSIKDKWKKAAG